MVGARGMGGATDLLTVLLLHLCLFLAHNHPPVTTTVVQASAQADFLQLGLKLRLSKCLLGLQFIIMQDWRYRKQAMVLWCGSKRLIFQKKLFSTMQRPSWDLRAFNILKVHNVSSSAFSGGQNQSNQDHQQGHCDVDQSVWLFYRGFSPHLTAQAEIFKHSIQTVHKSPV